MPKFVNNNELIRKKMRQLFGKINKGISIETDCDLYFENIINYLNAIEQNNKALYKQIIGLFFIDSMCYVKAKKSEEFDVYAEIESIDDLIDKIYVYDVSLAQLINFSKGFYSMPKKNQYKGLYSLSDEYILRFSVSSYFEKQNIFMTSTTEEFKLIYTENKKKDRINSYDLSIYEIIKKLEALYIGNYENCFSLILEMVKYYYKVMKVMIHKSRFAPQDEDLVLIELIETKSIKEIFTTIFNDYELLDIVIRDYIYYSCNKNQMLNNMNAIYENITDDKVKEKLK